MLQDLTSAQIAEWEAFNRLEPIGNWTDDFRFARLMSMIMNIVKSIWGKKGSSKKMSKPSDFMPDWEGKYKEPKKQTVDQMKNILLGIASQSKKKDKKDG